MIVMESDNAESLAWGALLIGVVMMLSLLLFDDSYCIHHSFHRHPREVIRVNLTA